jgi:hypothetical protein
MAGPGLLQPLQHLLLLLCSAWCTLLSRLLAQQCQPQQRKLELAHSKTDLNES